MIDEKFELFKKGMEEDRPRNRNKIVVDEELEHLICEEIKEQIENAPRLGPDGKPEPKQGLMFTDEEWESFKHPKLLLWHQRERANISTATFPEIDSLIEFVKSAPKVIEGNLEKAKPYRRYRKSKRTCPPMFTQEEWEAARIPDEEPTGKSLPRRGS